MAAMANGSPIGEEARSDGEALDAPLDARRERLLLLVLAAINFTHIMDFMIVIPLGPLCTQDMAISIEKFSQVVAAYGISASVAGLLAGLFLDRFDRKKALLFLYSGFTVGTFLCAVAPSYLLLVLARVVAGGFGGLVAATVLAIVGDVFPDSRRGRAMGAIMSAFSVASIVGVPAGLYLAGFQGWRTPFWVLAALSLVVLVLARVSLPPVRSHLDRAPDSGNRLADLWAIVAHPRHLPAFALMIALVMGGFIIIPNLPHFLERNVGMAQDELPLMYLFGGVASLLTNNVVGWLADRFGKRVIFQILAVVSMVPLLLVTHLPRVPLFVSLAVTTLMMVAFSGRYVPAMALMTGCVEPRERGRFMSVLTAVQQMVIGLAVQVGAWIIVEPDDNGPLGRFGVAGWVAVAFTGLSLLTVIRLRPAESLESAPAPDAGFVSETSNDRMAPDTVPAAEPV
jgi:multidrug resistance protein